MTRKLDALVAERVMGFVYKLGQPIGSSGPKCHGWGLLECPWIDPKLPRYSTDIAAAWMVVEKLVSSGAEGWESQQFSLTLEAGAECGDWYWDCWISKGPKREAAWGMSSFVPMAICLAALKAVGVDRATIDEALNKNAPD